MHKHTPGPWVVKDDGEGPHIMAGEIDIATAVGPFANGQQQEAEANARLIAAAPELLSIAQRASEWERKYPAYRIYSEGEIRSIAVEMTAIVKDADAVIAKVEGQS